MTELDLETARWLVDTAKRLEQANISAKPSVAEIQRLRSQFTAGQVAAWFELRELRQRAGTKFSKAGHMFFTRRGYEQSTGTAIAGYKAARFSHGSTSVDLCCGIGGDLLGLAERCQVSGLDVDPATCEFARANLLATGRHGEVVCQSATEAAVAAVEAWHLDPDRRAKGNRTTQPDWFEPDAGEFSCWLEVNPNAAIKLAPATDLTAESWAAGLEWNWIGCRRECSQLVVWSGALARDRHRRATLVDDEGRIRGELTAETPLDLPTAEQWGDFVYEPHATVLAAGLPGVFCAQFGLESITARGGYLTGSRAFHPLMDAFEIEEVLPWKEKRVYQWLRDHQAGLLEIKKRGVEVDPNQLQRKWKLPGDRPYTLLLTIWQGRRTAIIARRLAESATSDPP